MENGGKPVRHTITPRKRELALLAAACWGWTLAAWICSTGTGLLLCEVNSNAHFKALQAVSGISPADAIVAMMLERMP